LIAVVEVVSAALLIGVPAVHEFAQGGSRLCGEVLPVRCSRADVEARRRLAGVPCSRWCESRSLLQIAEGSFCHQPDHSARQPGL
jgi:hypothetical protein